MRWPCSARSTSTRGADRVRYSRDGKFLAAGNANNSLRLWEANTGREVRRFEQRHVAALRRMIPSTPRGKNRTTSTKNAPMKDIQFTVIDDM